MTRDATRARQMQAAPAPLRMVRVTINTVTPLTVNLRGSVVPGIKVAGLTYTAGATADAIYQEPAVFSVFPRA